MTNQAGTAPCAGFCDLPSPESGISDVHGGWCISEPCGPEIVTESSAGRLDITVDVAAAYPPADGADCASRPLVRLVLDAPHDETGGLVLYLDPSSARSLAIIATSAADLADALS